MAVFNDDLLFIHIPKTGGWWAKTYLKEHVPGINFPEDLDYPFPIGHIPLRDIEKFTGRSPSSWQKIVAVIRNPYEQQLSQWLYWKDRYARYGEHYHDTRAAIHPRIESWLRDQTASDFHAFYEQRIAGRSTTVSSNYGFIDFGSYYRYWIEVDDGIPDNVEVVKFENLNHEFRRAVAPFAGGIYPAGEKLNVGPGRKNPKAYYSHAAMQIVEFKFRWAFEHHYEPWERQKIHYQC